MPIGSLQQHLSTLLFLFSKGEKGATVNTEKKKKFKHCSNETELQQNTIVLQPAMGQVHHGIC